MNNLETAVFYMAAIVTVGVIYYIHSHIEKKREKRNEIEKAEAVNRAIEETVRQYERRAFLAELKAERQMKEAVDKAIKDTTMLYDGVFKEVKGIKVKVL